jgi:glucokinase
MKEVVIGIDIGGTYTKFGVVDRDGNTYGDATICTECSPLIDDYMKAIHKGVNDMLAKIKEPEPLHINGIGIGVPNSNYHTGTVEYAVNLPWKGVIPLVKLFEKYFNIPTVLTNDANAAALGEMIFGAAKGMKDFIVITLGTGLGSGIVVNGEVVYGHDGLAGELGHTIVIPNGRICACERRGCLEAYVSAPGIKRTVYELLAEYNGKSELKKYAFDDLSSEMISEAANHGDPVALRAFEFTVELLTVKLADAIAHTSPEAIFLFGGLAKAGNLILDPLRKNLDDALLSCYRNKVKIIPSGLMDKNAAIMGSSALIWKELDKKK